jgi:hypothetical protein
VRAQARLLDALSGGLDGFINLGCNQAVVQAPADRDIEVDFFTRLVTYTELILSKADDSLFALRQRNFCFFSRPSRDGAQRFVLRIGRQVFRQIKVVEQPRFDDVVEQDAVEIAPTAHGNAAMSQQVHATTDTLGNRNIQRATANVVHDKNAVVFALAHDAHHGSDRLLHQCNPPEPGCICGSHRGVLLHLVERGGNRDDGAGVAIPANLLRQIAKERTQHLGGTFLRRHREVDRRQLHGRARAHEPLEQYRRVVGILCGAVVGARADVLVAAPVDEDGRGRYIVLFGAFVEVNLVPIERADGTVGRAEVDTDVFHASTFLSITVPCLRSPFGPMMIGSSI